MEDITMMDTRSTTVAKMQSALVQTLLDSQIRTEVEACMSCMLQDVETTSSLQQQLIMHSNQQNVDKLAREQKATILEAEAERIARDEHRLELADQFVGELMTLSRELERLLQWKKDHEHKVSTYDELLAKLIQTEEELKSANRVSYGGSPIERQPAPREREAPTIPSNEEPIKPQSETEFPGEKDSSEQETTGDDSNEPVADNTDTSPVDMSEEDDEKKPAALEPNTEPEVNAETVESAPDTDTDREVTEEKSPPNAAAVVSLDDEEFEEEVPSLVEVDMEILMNIFGYLDAVDILNMAQINIAMYTRVDTIFGIAEDGHSMPQPTPAPAPAKKETPPQRQTPAQQQTRPPTIAQPPPIASKPALIPSTDSGNNSGKGLFSMLQPRVGAVLQPRVGAARAPGQPAKAGKSQPLNANLAKSMASKLTDAELAAIISMTDKLSKLDKEVNLLRHEKEALTAKLEGTESVKQFLIGKVRDVEVKLKQREEDDVKITQQIASDQEVIAFLDSRVQELELSADDVVKNRDSIQGELKSLKNSSSKKTTMLNDMLKYEREKLREEESEWKATKKVLVKEVKNCRAQILALQAERDGFKEQNEMLKRAIVSTGKAVASPSR